MLKLYDYFRSSACYRVRIALNLKQLPYELIPIHLVKDGGEQHTSSYEEINPQKLIPSLDHQGNILTQSLAIIEYLDELHPTPALLPKNAVDKAYVRSIALTIAADVHPLNNLRVLNYLKNNFNISDEQKKIWYHEWLQQGFQAIEKKLIAAKLMGNFCFGDSPTLADICLIPQLYNAHRFECDLKPYENIRRIESNCREVPAFVAAFPKGD